MGKKTSFRIWLLCGHSRLSFHGKGTGNYYCGQCKGLVRRDEDIPAQRESS